MEETLLRNGFFSMHAKMVKGRKVRCFILCFYLLSRLCTYFKSDLRYGPTANYFLLCILVTFIPAEKKLWDQRDSNLDSHLKMASIPGIFCFILLYFQQLFRYRNYILAGFETRRSGVETCATTTTPNLNSSSFGKQVCWPLKHNILLMFG